jgi:hypothetical protein
MMKVKQLFDTGAGPTCMSSKQFRLIPIKKRPNKLQLNHREARGASGTALIIYVSYGMEWKNGEANSDSVQKFGITLDFGN